METLNNFIYGTCSWKYPSWNGLVYSENRKDRFLSEYSQKYSTVEVDQWFWSLFAKNKPVLPKKEIALEYYNETPDSFSFSIKAPNSISLTHYYSKYTNGNLVENEHFLSIDLYKSFLNSLDLLRNKTQMILLQFEYLNKQKISSFSTLLDKLDNFLDKIDRTIPIAIEFRNPQYINSSLFNFFKKHKIIPVLMQGYYMPDIVKAYSPFLSSMEKSDICIRLMGNDRKGIEDRTGKIYNSIVDNREDELDKIAVLLNKFLSSSSKVYLYANNHFEGSAPLTLKRLKNLIE